MNNEGRFSGCRILVVDDEPDILASTSLSLQAEGADVVTAEDGNTAVSLFASTRPDGVVLDMMLPRRSGFLVLEKIRDSEHSPPVVMVTANQGRRHMTYAENLGATAYLVKPVSMPRLLEVLAESMGLR